MPPKCINAQPTFRMKMHIPATDWHPHYDKVINVKQPTEFQAWAVVMSKVLEELTGGNARLMVGYWGDVLNTLPDEFRKALVQVLTQGLGLSIKTGEEPDTVEVDMVTRYPPLVEQPPQAGELVVPKPKASGLVFPGQPGYTG